MFLPKHLIAVVIILLFISFSTFAVEFRGAGISFEPPEGFTELTDDLLKIKFPGANRPKFVYGNEDFSVTVTVTPSGKKASKVNLKEILKAMEKAYSRIIPNLVWIKKEVAEFNDQTWLHLELTSTAIDADIHNNVYMTTHRGKLVAFNFNATKEMYKQYKTQLEQSFNSIKLIK